MRTFEGVPCRFSNCFFLKLFKNKPNSKKNCFELLIDLILKNVAEQVIAIF